VDFWTGREREGEWIFDVDELEQIVNSGPKPTVLVVNFPHNPSGFVPSPAEWERIISLCQSHEMYLFSDEMYWELFHTTPPLTSAVSLYDKAITLSGMSKSYALPGLRLGWLACRDKEFMAKVLTLKDFTTICGPGPSEVLALIALRNRERILQRTRAIISANVRALRAFCAAHTSVFDFRQPRGGLITFIPLKGAAASKGAGAFSEELVREAGILLLPSDEMEMGETTGCHFRFGLGRVNFLEGLRALHRYLSSGEGATESWLTEDMILRPSSLSLGVDLDGRVHEGPAEEPRTGKGRTQGFPVSGTEPGAHT